MKNFDAESLIGGENSFLESDGKKYKIEVKGIPECTKSCPAGVNVKAYVHLIANRKFEEAIEVIRQSNPFPAVCGRVCTRPCEEVCELGEKGDPVSIRALKRYASDYELARRPITINPCEIVYDEKVAVIGAGPSGLTAAVDLINIGYPVTVFEEKKDPGGMLRYGIPPYRLPDRILRREIDWIKGLGVQIKTGIKINDPSSLFKKGFSAVLIAGGAPKSFPLGIEGEKADGVIDALLLLKEINSGNRKKIKGDVIVIGGGSTAFDAARSAIRIGAKKVTLAYRRGIEEMPAEEEEIQAALLEKINIMTLVIPKRIIEKNGKAQGVEFLKARLGETDKSGRRKPVPIDNSEFIEKTDLVIKAVGAMPDVGLIDGVKVTTPKGVIEIIENGKTVVEGIFAAGDVEMGPSSVVDAIGRGHDAARGIDAYLRGTVIPKKEEMIKSIQISLGSTISRTAYKPKRLALGGKISSFDEVEESLTDYQAVEEASRCFNCGPCYSCPVCLPNCKNKQLIAEIDDKTFLVKAPLVLSKDLTQKGSSVFKIKSDDNVKSIRLHSLASFVNPDLCIGCGRCEEVCAYRAIKNIIIKDERIVSQVYPESCASCSACVSECPSGAISQGYMSDNLILKRIEDKKTSYKGVKALMSYWSNSLPTFGEYDGVVELMSGRKPSPSFLIRALARSGKGLLVIKPDEVSGSHYLPWEEEPSEVIQKTWDLLRLVGVPPDRIQYKELHKDEDPSVLIDEFSKDLDKKKLGEMFIPVPKSIKSPLGESIALLRIMSANPDMKPSENTDFLPVMRSGGVAFFEACLPLLHRVGEAQKLYDLKRTRLAMFQIIKKLKIDAGLIKGLSCPSKGLLNTKTKGINEIVSRINSNNLQVIKKLKPKKILLPTPESFLSFSKEEKFGASLSFPDEVYKILKKYKKFYPVNKTVAVHHACQLEKDPFYETIKEILRIIPGVKIVELDKIKCGNSGFEDLNGKSKQSAINILKNASEKGADMLICTSPYCEAHLLLCQREGSWRTVDVEISDVYRILLSSLEGYI